MIVAGVVVAALPPVAGAQPADEDRVRVVHLVVDSLLPSQVGPLTPVLAELEAGGTWYEQVRGCAAG